MTKSCKPADRYEHTPQGRRRCWSSRSGSTAATATLLALAVFAAGCGGAPSKGGSGPMARFVDYAVCMRSHGIHDFPDPVASPGGGVAFQVDGGPGSDLNRNNPTFKTAEQACQSLLPGAGRAPAQFRRRSSLPRSTGRAACARTGSRTSPTPTLRVCSTAPGSTRARPRSKPPARPARRRSLRGRLRWALEGEKAGPLAELGWHRSLALRSLSLVGWAACHVGGPRCGLSQDFPGRTSQLVGM